MRCSRLITVPAVAAAVAVVLVGAACTSFSSDDGPASDDGGAVDATESLDAPRDARSEGDAAPPEGMVAVQNYFIDKREVSNSAYAEFAAASLDGGLATLDIPAKCSFKTDYGFDTNCHVGTTAQSAYPATCIDWCDAYVYCKYRGKRLCGSIRGGPVAPGLATDSQWANACSGGTRQYPYGSTYDPARCNTGDIDAGPDGGAKGPKPSGSFSRCQGSVNNLFDMAGNVWEWEDSCDPGDGGDAGECRTRGGDAFNPGTSCDCNYAEKHSISFVYNTTGFRCCSGP